MLRPLQLLSLSLSLSLRLGLSLGLSLNEGWEWGQLQVDPRLKDRSGVPGRIII